MIVFLVGVQTFVNAVVEVIEGGDVKLPDVFGLPRGEGVWVYGLDVGVGQHLQAFRRFDFASEGANRFGIEDVSTQGGGYFQMIRDEEQDDFAFGRFEIEAIDTALGNLKTGLHMVRVGGAFAGIV